MKLTISHQLSLMAFMAIVMLVIVGLIGNRVAQSVDAAAEYSEKTTIPAVEAIASMRLTAVEIRMAGLNHATSWIGDEKKELDKRVDELKKRFTDSAATYEKLAQDEASRKFLATDRKAYAEFIAILDEARELSSGNRNEQALKKFVTGNPVFATLNDSLTAHTAYTKKLATEQREAANTSANKGLTLSIASIVLGALLVAGFSFVLIRGIRVGLNTMVKTVSHVESALDLTARVPARREDEIGKMGAALNRLLVRLQSNLQSVAHAAEEVSHAAEAMTESSRQVASASDAQSTAASNMAASMEELTVSINHVGDRAGETRERAAHAGALATEGESVVVKTVNDIDAIAQSVNASADLINKLENQSQQITSVVQVIKDVADQTNLLALNAAIEAARAGEQGRGFAVVADEVRKLAERTGKSTQEITDTVGAMRQGAQAASTSMRSAVEQVSASVTRASGAGETIRRIGEGSRAAEGMVGEITDAILEQSSASTAVAQSVERIAQMAEESTVAAKRSAASAERLTDLAHEMHGITAQYKL